jgi:hypothetical protein
MSLHCPVGNVLLLVWGLAIGAACAVVAVVPAVIDRGGADPGRRMGCFGGVCGRFGIVDRRHQGAGHRCSALPGGSGEANRKLQV